MAASAVRIRWKADVAEAVRSERGGSMHPPSSRHDGLWIKDKSLSDSLGPAADLVRLNPLVRRAVVLVKGIRIQHTGTEFELTVVSHIGWFKVVERYPLDGGVVEWKRRDLRGGRHQGYYERFKDGSERLTLTWPEPYGGRDQTPFSLWGQTPSRPPAR